MIYIVFLVATANSSRYRLKIGVLSWYEIEVSAPAGATDLAIEAAELLAPSQIVTTGRRVDEKTYLVDPRSVRELPKPSGGFHDRKA